MTDIFSLSLEELAAQIKDAQLTSVDVCKKYIERINKFEKDVKAWAHFDKKVLLEKAAEADAQRRSGKPPKNFESAGFDNLGGFGLEQFEPR